MITCVCSHLVCLKLCKEFYLGSTHLNISYQFFLFVFHVQVSLRDRATKGEHFRTHSSIYSFITRNTGGYSLKK